MDKKLIILLIAIVGALLCCSPIMASDNSMVTYSFLDGIFGDNHLDIDNLIIEKEYYKHTDANGKVDKYFNYYLDFNINDDSDSFGKYSAKISSFNKFGNPIESVDYDIAAAGDHRVKFDSHKKVANVSIEITDENGNVVFNNTTDSIKKTKDITKDKPVEKKTTTSSSSSGATYWASSNSDKFHYPSCEWAQKISGRNKVVFHSRDEAISSGYQPCQVCGP